MHGGFLFLVTLGLGWVISAQTLAKGEQYAEASASAKKVTVIKVDLKEDTLTLFHKDDSGQPLKSFEGINQWLHSKGEQLRFAMNAGMYHGDFSAVGLYVANGIELAPLNLQPGEGNFFLKPNGVFCITDRGARVVESSLYPSLKQKEKVELATQSGPMLLIDGKVHPVFNPKSESRLYRNGVGVRKDAPNEVLFAISEEPVNFYEFATFFRDTLKCNDALFLDGTISSLYSTKLKRSDKKMDLGPIIGITESINKVEK